MAINFLKIAVGGTFSRGELAKLWGYKSFHAIARGIVTPQGDNKIVVFITEEKQSSARQYVDSLHGKILLTEGPDDHFAEQRIASAASTGEEIHLFHRKRHHTDFTYKGKMKLLALQPGVGAPSQFKYEVL